MMFFLYLVFPINLIFKVLLFIKKLNNLNLLNLDNLKRIQEILNFKLKQKKVIYPVLTTHYEREYFISLNGKIRATVAVSYTNLTLQKREPVNVM